MTLLLTTLLVGSHFVPPAKTLLEHLPVGARLFLQAEPDNPYDENAILVLLSPGQIPASQHDELAVKLPGTGHSLDELLDGPAIPIGHVASSEGKPLLQANAQGAQYVGTKEFLPLLDDAGTFEFTLGFDGSGKPLVHVQRADESARE